MMLRASAMGQSYSTQLWTIKPIWCCFVVLLLVGCSQVSQEAAEQATHEFVRDRVVPFARGDSESLPDYDITTISSAEISGAWQITLRLSASVNGTVKETTVEVTVNSRTGEVTHFNGDPVPTT